MLHGGARDDVLLGAFDARAGEHDVHARAGRQELRLVGVRRDGGADAAGLERGGGGGGRAREAGGLAGELVQEELALEVEGQRDPMRLLGPQRDLDQGGFFRPGRVHAQDLGAGGDGLGARVRGAVGARAFGEHDQLDGVARGEVTRLGGGHGHADAAFSRRRGEAAAHGRAGGQRGEQEQSFHRV